MHASVFAAKSAKPGNTTPPHTGVIVSYAARTTDFAIVGALD
jgi:hypothetical protein